MRTDFTPDNVELWISNWRRKDHIDRFVREWLNSFDFERVNVITNHSSVTIDDFSPEIAQRVKIWNNVMRHDSAIGPMNENYNQAYVHTFLSGKKYCLCAHDNMLIKEGWDQLIRETDYELYMAPQGDQVHLMTLEGLRHYGWWDERYATNGNHELDFIVRALQKDLLTGDSKSTIFDLHAWHGWPRESILSWRLPNGVDVQSKNPVVYGLHPEMPGLPTLAHNPIGLENYWIRSDKNEVPQTGPKTPNFRTLKWNNEKWGGDPQSFEHFCGGPSSDEIDWYPWLDLGTLTTDTCAIK